MFSVIIAILCTLHIFSQHCNGIFFVDLPGYDSDENSGSSEQEIESTTDTNPETFQQTDHSKHPPVRNSKTSRLYVERRDWPAEHIDVKTMPVRRQYSEADENLKNKISTLVEQTLHDTDLKIKSIKFKEKDESLYKVGVVLSLIKKSRETINELFNVAVKHRDSWKALEQLKIFELIIHTNVDTTNYVRQLVEYHTAISGGNTTNDATQFDSRFHKLLDHHKNRITQNQNQNQNQNPNQNN